MKSLPLILSVAAPLLLGATTLRTKLTVPLQHPTGPAIAKDAPSLSGNIILNAPNGLTNYKSAPLTLVHFWTFNCINCRHNLPIYNDWNRKFKGRGLNIIGVHSPETEFEAVSQNVEAATKKEGIKYSILVDSQMKNWKRWGVHYWPSYYLINSSGKVVASGDGEIHEDRTEWESKIDRYLREAGR